MVEEARYLYSVAKTELEEQMGSIGIEEKPVYIIPYKDIAAVVHSCEPRPYDTKDRRLAEEWVLEHSYVIDQATKRFGTVLPFSFDVILRGSDETVKDWLSRNYDLLVKELHRVEGEAEYTIQIYYDYDDLASGALNRNRWLLDLKSKIEKEPRGKAYLLQRNLDLKLKGLVSSEASRLADEFCSKIRPLVEELAVDGKPKASENYREKKLMVSCSCLVREENVERLGEVLDEINHLEGFAVRFTGPWAPFSFVRLQEAR